MATMQERITALAQAVGADIKALQAVGGDNGSCVGGPTTPALVSPAPGGIGNRDFVVGTYSHQNNFAKWCTQIQRARDAAFTVDVELSPIDAAHSGTSVHIPWSEREGINYWRARDIDIFGNASAWSAAQSFNWPAEDIAVAGGTIADDGVYAVHTFTGSGTLTVTGGALVADVLVVAGGGAGGGTVGGGGGGGGVVYKTSQTLAAGSYAVTVGAGGAVGAANGLQGNNGGDSSIAGIEVAVGGSGGAGINARAPKSGGSGGGSFYDTPNGGEATAGQGFRGGNGGVVGASAGGGGGGAVGMAGTGAKAGNGGAGFACAISPAATHYAGGGGGGCQTGYVGVPGDGGTGGGGAGSMGVGASATANTGGGGGAGGYNGTFNFGGAGGDGIVIIRYLKE